MLCVCAHGSLCFSEHAQEEASRRFLPEDEIVVREIAYKLPEGIQNTLERKETVHGKTLHVEGMMLPALRRPREEGARGVAGVASVDVDLDGKRPPCSSPKTLPTLSSSTLWSMRATKRIWHKGSLVQRFRNCTAKSSFECASAGRRAGSCV